MAIWSDHQVSATVWIDVHNDETMPGPKKHAAFLVFLGTFGQAENAGIGFGAENILNAPGRVKSLHDVVESGSEIFEHGPMSVIAMSSPGQGGHDIRRPIISESKAKVGSSTTPVSGVAVRKDKRSSLMRGF
jgi:hypothetical protein